jgi:phosphoserine aminotransferase
MRVINFNAGPAGLPLPALERARDELLDFEGSGMSIMEHSHRGKDFERVHDETLARLGKLLGVPDSHQVLFLQGGASLQFAMVPMNFLPAGKSADYVLTGGWAEKAYEEAQRLGKVRLAASTRLDDGRFTRVPKQAELSIDPDAAYCHTTSNNTLFGSQFQTLPDTGKVQHVCDMSSDFLSRAIDVKKFHLIYAGAQKNIGPSGLVVAIADKAWMQAARKDCPKVLRYWTYAEANSLYNTPNTWGIYLARNVLRWIEEIGGLGAIEKRNDEKAKRLYAAIDAAPDFFKCPVEPASRSKMNVVFRLPSEALEDQFVAEAKKAGMVGLKGHRSTGGIRVSTYNAVSVEDVSTLVQFMQTFAGKHR